MIIRPFDDRRFSGLNLSFEPFAIFYQDFIRQNPGWNRTRLSRELCRCGSGRCPPGNIAYLAMDSDDRPLGAMLLGLPHGKWPGVTLSSDGPIRSVAKIWASSPTTPASLFPPWIRVPHLATHLLSQAARRISADWKLKYDHELFLLETFVEQGCFKGTSRL